MIVIGCATWFYFTPQSHRDMIYAPTIIMGAGNSMMLVTSLAMVADLIGDDKVGFALPKYVTVERELKNTHNYTIHIKVHMF